MTLFGDNTPNDTPVNTRPQWTAVSGNTRCDQCITEALAARKPGQVIELRIMPARQRRVHNNTDRRYCYQHARPIRANDDTNNARADGKAPYG